MAADRRVHVFTGAFPTRADALEYTEQRRGPEPPETASDAEHQAWEDSPIWPLVADLGVGWLDHDYIETITAEDGGDLWGYLSATLADARAAERLRRFAGDADTLVLVFDKALLPQVPAPRLQSTPRLRYWGAFASR